MNISLVDHFFQTLKEDIYFMRFPWKEILLGWSLKIFRRYLDNDLMIAMLCRKVLST